MQHKICKNKYLYLVVDVRLSHIIHKSDMSSLHEATVNTLIKISQNWKQKTTSGGLNFCPRTKKTELLPYFLGTLRAITVWLPVITTQSRPSKDALSDLI